MGKETLGIIGAAGNVGSEVIQQLKKSDVHIVALARTPEKAQKLDVEIRPFDFTREDTFKTALQGIDKLLLIAKKGSDHISKFLKHASHIEQIVVVSGVSAIGPRTSHLAALENCVYDAKLPFTVLRMNWFMQNFITFLRDDIVSRGLIELPAGSSKTAFVDVRDVASCIVKVFEGKDHLNQVYTITGKEALTHGECAEKISAVIGKKVIYKSISDDEAKKKFLALGWPPESVDETVLLFKEMRDGATNIVTQDVKKLLKKDPITFSEFTKDYKHNWL